VKLRLQGGLLYATATIEFRGKQTSFDKVLIDTGSGGTIFSSDKLLTIGLQLEPQDFIHRIRGVGGTEFVFAKQVNRLSVGELAVNNFEIEVGAMDYGFDLDGIVGTDFLRQAGAIIDLVHLEIRVGTL
jgi:hypothetical protein